MATPPYLSPFEFPNNNYYYYDYHGDDFSSGYLEDALLELGDRSKRRRLSFSSPDHAHSPGYVNSDLRWDTSTTRFSGFSDELGWISHSMSKETTNVASEVPTSSEDAMSSLSSFDSSTCSVLNPKPPSNPAPTIAPSGMVVQEMEKRKQRVIKGVAYPFALVKPGGTEGDVTLDDINARILMTPTRPVRHPVGEFACRSYGGERGPSGKAVVGLTRLHTQGGRGSITIIRTKG